MENYWNNRRRRVPSDAWRYPGMLNADRMYERNDNRYAHEGGGYPDDRYGRGHNESRRYYDSDIYEQEIGRRDARYADEPTWPPDQHYRERYPSDRDDFFHRAGHRLMEWWHRWTDHHRDEEPRGAYFGERFHEDHNERRYGRDNWAPNANRGRASNRRRYGSRHYQRDYNPQY